MSKLRYNAHVQKYMYKLLPHLQIHSSIKIFKYCIYYAKGNNCLIFALYHAPKLRYGAHDSKFDHSPAYHKITQS